MNVFYPSLNVYHNPTKDYSDGFPPYDYIENPERLDLIIKGIKKADSCKIIKIIDIIEISYLTKLHSVEYVNFLKKLSNELSEYEEYIPSIFRNKLDLAPVKFQGGMFCKEIGTPIMKKTFITALNSANTCLEAAKYLHNNNESVFAMTRPPGHHAGISSYGGYSFFNNCIVAANYFLEKKLRPIVLDIDYHVGDGTIEFAEKLNIPYYSINIDPWKNYPYFDVDIKFKSNIKLLHLQHNTSGKEYLKYLNQISSEIKKRKFDILILSLGFDIVQTDYCQDENILISNNDFLKIGEIISKQITKKVLICLEGGYDKPNLEDCAYKFTKGFLMKTKKVFNEK